MENFAPYHQNFNKLFDEDRMKGIVSQLFAEESVLFQEKINFKMPDGDGFRAHQDVQAGWDNYAALHITALLSIDPCTEENGCLEMASSQHDKGLIGDKWKLLNEDTLNCVSVPTKHWRCNLFRFLCRSSFCGQYN